MSDPIDQAIAGPPRVPSTTVQVELPGSGGLAILTVPTAISDSQWLALVGRIPKIRDGIRKVHQATQLATPDPLVIARGEIPKPPRNLTD